MKKIIILSFVLLIASPANSQSFTASWELNNETKLVHLFVDAEFGTRSTVIVKEFVETSKGTSILKDDLILLGDFKTTTGNNFLLDYEKYNYYLVSFDPEGPILFLHNSIPSGITKGTLFIDNAEFGGDGGDRTYWCDCGGVGAPATDPGGCVSELLNLFGSKQVRCVSDGGSCTQGCIGQSTPSSSVGKTTGGGILLQVPKENDILLHDIRTRL